MTDFSVMPRAARHVATHTAILLATTVLLSSCGGGSSQPAQEPDNLNMADEAYESLPTYRASDLLPEQLLSGERHSIAERVENDGYENRYTIESDYGTFTAHRTDFVAERVQEVYAIEELNKVTRSEAFAQGVAQAAASPFRALKGLATEPVGTVTGVFQGVGALFSQAGEMVTGSRGELEGSAAQELVGFGEVKREIAEILSVDPYTTNPQVQEGMNEVAWAGFAGGLSLAPLTASVGGGAGVALSGLQNSQTLNSLLTSQSPEALRSLNRDRMQLIGVDEDVSEIFLQHPWLSPRHETTIVVAMAGLEGAANRDAFFQQSVISESEQQSIFLMRQAEATLGYHQNVAAVDRLNRANRQVLAYTQDGRAISILPADHLVWGVGASVIADQDVEGSAVRELWLTGSISDRARREFTDRGWLVMSNMSDRLAPDLDAVFQEMLIEPSEQEQAATGSS